MSDDELAIRELGARWFDATKSGDTATVVSLMTDDAVFMVPGREPFGKEAFQGGANAMTGVRIDGTSDILELLVADDWAFMRSHTRVTMTPPQGPTVRLSGHILTILRKDADGQWRLARDANLLTVER